MLATNHRTQVAIIGAGPSGLMLSLLLHNQGIDSILIERQSQAYVESRVRAGVLEQGTVDALIEAGAGDRLRNESIPHNGFSLMFDGEEHRIDLSALTKKQVHVYGQTEVTKDLFALRHSQNAQIYFSADDVTPQAIDSEYPFVEFTQHGQPYRINCEYIAGCDGYHGVSRKSIPTQKRQTFERNYPFSWLGILSESPPVSDELIYANHANGFALCSMRSSTRSRYYIQVDATDKKENWSDDAFFNELSLRIGDTNAAKLQRGESFEKSIAPLRSFVAEPMRYGNLFLAGDAAHIVPPTGAKGLNLAIADVRILARAFHQHYNHNERTLLENYSQHCLSRVWKVERFSWYLSMLMHQIPTHSEFEKKIQRAEFDYIRHSEAASRSIAENYVGLSLEFN